MVAPAVIPGCVRPHCLAYAAEKIVENEDGVRRSAGLWQVTTVHKDLPVLSAVWSAVYDRESAKLNPKPCDCSLLPVQLDTLQSRCLLGPV